MAYANLNATLIAYKLRRNGLNVEITNMQSQKTPCFKRTIRFRSTYTSKKS